MLNLNANIEGWFHVKHESKNLETRKIHEEKVTIHLLFWKYKDQKSDL